MNRSTLSRIIPFAILLAAWAAPAGAASGDAVADRVLGQRRLSTSIPYFVDGRVFSATDVAVDRSVTPNRIYLADPDLNRVLGWSDIRQFRARAAADLVLGQTSQFTGQFFYRPETCTLAPSATTFCRPTRVAVDPGGNLYVADAFNFRVLEFDSPFTTDRTADRVFGQPDSTTRARTGSEGVDPELLDVATDGLGNVWMIDPSGSRRILEFDNPLTHDTVADRVIEPSPPSECGTISQKAPCSPSMLDVSPQGDLYVQDRYLFVYRQPLTTDLAADLLLNVGLGLPGMTFDPEGNLYYTVSRAVARFHAPIGPDAQPEVLLQVREQEAFGRLDRDSEGNLYAAYYGYATYHRNFVYVYPAPLQPRSEPFRIGRERLTNQGLQHPVALAVDRSSTPNHLYVLDEAQRLLGWRDAEGFANGAPADLVLADPTPCFVGHLCLGNRGIFTNNLAVDSKGNLWVSSTGANFAILELNRPFETDLVPDRKLGKAGCAPDSADARSLCHPGALAFDRDDNLYVADLGNHRVLLFKDPLRDGVADKVFGQPNFQAGDCNRGNGFDARAVGLCFGYEDGYPNSYFFGAGGLAVDTQGNLYVADSLNNRVLIFKDAARSDTVPDAVLGQDGNFRTRLSGTGAKRFGGTRPDSPDSTFGPSSLAIGPRGELYVADSTNDRLLVFLNPLRDDVADRVFGHPGFDIPGVPLASEFGPSPLPPPTAARLLRPTALAFDVEGNLYVADTFYNRVLVFDRP
jgi:DNA-binding beta-propeller fold protein YncE